MENVLLHATEDDRIVIVAGRRIDGQDTVAEMAQVVQRTFHTIVKTSADVVGWPQLDARIRWAALGQDGGPERHA